MSERSEMVEAHLTVDEATAGTRLDVLLAGELGVSRSRAAARIDAGEVLIDGRAVTRRRPVRAGERIELRASAEPATTPAPPLPPVRYQDEHLLVLAKPPGLVVHPGAGNPDGTLVQALEAGGVPLATGGGDQRPGIVHRLDRDTSGLLIVASTGRAYDGLVAALSERRVERRYLALVAGVPSDPRGRIEAPIGRHPSDRVRFAVTADGRPATTRYRVLATGQAPDLPAHRGEVALLACQLETGRTHQLRVHLTELGHPIAGDRVYRAMPALAAALELPRLFLHAASLRFTHPVTGERVAVDEPLADDLRPALARAGIELPDVTALTEVD